MGLPLNSEMSDLHTPTVASGSTSTSYNSDANESESIQELMRKKEQVEEEMKELASVLKDHKVTMETPLTTFDGYPRADLDIAQIRTVRARMIHLKNDHKSLMARIEPLLHAYFASNTTVPDSSASALASAAAPTPAVATSLPAFARVASVVPSSPAEEAGLRAGDSIQRFGTADWGSSRSADGKLGKVAEVVSGSVGRPISVTVLRGEGATAEEQVILSLTPRRDWGGRGLLGCHLVPL